MKIYGIQHVAIAAKDPRAFQNFLEGVLGLQASSSQAVESQKTLTTFFSADSIGAQGCSTRIEMVEPLDGQGPIADYLSKKGGGIHHIALLVDDIDAYFAHCLKSGVQTIGDRVSQGAHGSKVFFVHPKSVGGVLVEFVEEQLT